MRYLILILLISAAAPAASEIESRVGTLVLFPSSELVEQQTSDSSGHLIVLGALEKVNHEVISENSVLVPGTKQAHTYYLPEARRTIEVAEFFKSQLDESASILFECKGRGCGSSSFWTNEHFKLAILYGPEQYQNYFVARLNTAATQEQTSVGGGYIVVYVAERAIRKIYVHVEQISPVNQ